MVGWNVQDALDDIDKAIKIEPRFLENYLYKARFLYVYFGNKEESLKLLDYVLKQDPNSFPEEVTANKVSQRTARELWKKITGKEYPQK
jgi:tetratricopeptide (TPR) repeat protein